MQTVHRLHLTDSVPSFGKLIDRIASLLAVVGGAVAAAREYERLRGQTDAALAAQGLTRESLPSHVFEKHLS